MSLSRRVTEELFKPVDAASLVFFRVGFGVIMMVEAWRYFSHGWIARYYIDPPFQFKYFGFEWVEPLPGDGMYWHFVLLALLSLFMTIGVLYRLSAVLFFFAFTYVFLLEQAHYLNHFYLVILIAFLMMVVPAHCAWSVDARVRPRLRSDTVPGWSVWLLRLQFEIMYLYAGIVKINEDWLRLEPMGMWLARRTDFPLIGPLFVEDWVVAIASYFAIILHVVGAPLLLFRRTRAYVIAVYFAFHLMNHYLFHIGIFPWLAMAGTLIFFDPDWPKQFLRWLRRMAARLLAEGGAPSHG